MSPEQDQQEGQETAQETAQERVEFPPRDFPPLDLAITRSHGSMRRWEGHLFRWSIDTSKPSGRWVYVQPAHLGVPER